MQTGKQKYHKISANIISRMRKLDTKIEIAQKMLSLKLDIDLISTVIGLDQSSVIFLSKYIF